MPHLQFKTNTRPGPEAARELSALVASLLEKPQSYVQIVIEPGLLMTFGGTSEPTAFIELSSLGLNEIQAGRCSEKLCAWCQETLSIPPDRVYLRCADHPRALWGWNGNTFA